MTTANSALSFQGLSSGVQTDSLIAAILAQKGTGLARMKTQQSLNAARTTALTTIQSNMNSVYLSLATIQDKLNARTVTSTDTNNTYVSATASGAAAGNYDIQVTTVATKGQIAPIQGTTLSVADPTAAIFSSSKASFAVQGTDGVTKTFQLSTNSLNGLRDAINASGAGVNATVVNTGSGTNPFMLVVTAKDTGTGSTNGLVKLAAIDNSDATPTTLISSAGVTLGSGLTGAVTGTFAAPTGITGGFTSAAAKDAVFTVNGISLTRKSNVVTDAADGVTFTLRQGGQTGTTTLTVGQDKTTATSGLQDLLTKYNTLLQTYNTATTVTKNADGSMTKGPLTGQATTRAMLASIKSALTGVSAGLPSSSSVQTLANLGVKTNKDGTLSLDTTTFQAALDKDPVAVRKLFTFSGDTTNGVVSFNGAGANTATGEVIFNVTQDPVTSALSGNFTGTYKGSAFNVDIAASNGTFTGAVGTALEGLSLSVTGAGTGTLTLVRGAGQATSDLLTSLAYSGSGSISSSLVNIQTQNRALQSQIDAAQSSLDRQKVDLQKQFANMEVIVGQLRAGASSLNGL